MTRWATSSNHQNMDWFKRLPLPAAPHRPDLAQLFMNTSVNVSHSYDYHWYNWNHKVPKHYVCLFGKCSSEVDSKHNFRVCIDSLSLSLRFSMDSEVNENGQRVSHSILDTLSTNCWWRKGADLKLERQFKHEWLKK